MSLSVCEEAYNIAVVYYIIQRFVLKSVIEG